MIHKKKNLVDYVVLYCSHSESESHSESASHSESESSRGPRSPPRVILALQCCSCLQEPPRCSEYNINSPSDRRRGVVSWPPPKDVFPGVPALRRLFAAAHRGATKSPAHRGEQSPSSGCVQNGKAVAYFAPQGRGGGPGSSGAGRHRPFWRRHGRSGRAGRVVSYAPFGRKCKATRWFLLKLY